MKQDVRVRRWAWAALVLASLVTWWPVWNEPFAEDDFLFLQVAGASSPAKLAGYFASEGVMDHHYRPLSDPLWFALATTPARYHAGLQLLHVAVALLIFSLGSALGLGTLGAFLGALLWATRDFAFPSMVWASGFSDLGSTVLALASLRAHLAWRGGGRAAARWGSVLLFVAAILTKETAIVTLALLPIVDHVRGASARKAVGVVLPYALVGIPIAVLQMGLARFADAYGQSLYALSIGAHTLWLGPVYVLWSFVALPSILRSAAAILVLVLAAVIALAVVALRVRGSEGRRSVLLGLGWFTAAIFPALFASGRINTNYVMLAAVGPCLAAGGFFAARCARGAAWRSGILGALTLLVLAGPILVLAKDWGKISSGGWVDPASARAAATLVDTVTREIVPDPQDHARLLLIGATHLNPMLMADLGGGFGPQSGLQAAFRRAYGRDDVQVVTLPAPGETPPAQMEAARRTIAQGGSELRVLKVDSAVQDVTGAAVAAARAGPNLDDFRRALAAAGTR